MCKFITIYNKVYISCTNIFLPLFSARWYNIHVATPSLANQKGGEARMEMFVTLLLTIVGGVIVGRINKWLDGE